jgi:hypothetical protein
MITKYDDLCEITILDDIEEEFFEKRMPEIAEKYLENLKDHIQESFRVAQTNKTTKMI